MTRRLSIISFAGMARTLVAVGMVSDDDMFLTIAAAGPRSTFDSSAAGSAGAVLVGAALEVGAGVVLACGLLPRACGGAAAADAAAVALGAAGAVAAGAAGAGAGAGAGVGAVLGVELDAFGLAGAGVA